MRKSSEVVTAITTLEAELAAFERSHDLSAEAERGEILGNQMILGADADFWTTRSIHRGMVERLAELHAELRESQAREAREAERVAARERELAAQLQAAKASEQDALATWTARFGNLFTDLSGQWEMGWNGRPRVAGRWDKDTPLVSLLSEAEVERLVQAAAPLDAWTQERGAQTVRNRLAPYEREGVRYADQMSESANWRPDSYSGVARRVGTSTFVEALISEFARLAEEARNPKPRPPPPRPPPARRWFK